MAKMTRKLYALAAELNLLERGNPEDPFHQIVCGITGKEHVSELTEKKKRQYLKNFLNVRGLPIILTKSAFRNRIKCGR